jgi:tol-pal system protein YbgF
MLNCVKLRPIIMGLALTGLYACVGPQRVELLEQEQRRTQSDTAAMQKQMELMHSSLSDTRTNIQQLERQLNSLNKSLEETRHQVGEQIDQSSRQGDQRVKNLEATVAKLTETTKANDDLLKLRQEELKELQKGMPSNQVSSPEATEPLLAENENVKRDYEVARQALGRKDYRFAIARFKDFLQKHPQSKLADSAQYWIGESHYALREFEQAIVEFDAVRSKYPQGEKVPAALLKQGFAFAELGENANAKLILQQVVDKYAQTPEAVQAKQKLQSLES